MQIYYEDEQVCLFAPDFSAGKMSPAHSRRQTGRTSGVYWRKLPELKYQAYMSLDLTPGHGNLLGESYWEILSPWRGGALMHNTGVSPRDAKESFLSQILEASPLPKYYLTKTACLGILRRAAERGKELPPQLKAALEIQAGLTPPDGSVGAGAYHMNQRDEGIDLGNVSGALMATANMQMQTFVTGTPATAAGFCAGASPTAGNIGYQEETSPTLKGAESGTNMVPSILCLNDQGGKRMDASENITGTLRADEKGHQPLVYENHGIDARYNGPYDVAPTMSARYGTGGNNVPLVADEPETYCIVGNVIDRKVENGGNGLGCQRDISYTLTGMDRHAIYSRQRVDAFKPGDIASTQSARQYKDATDLVCYGQSQFANYSEGVSTLRANGGDHGGGSENLISSRNLIRRLTPLECERLQGFPDGWTDIPDASDSARYKALGNSVAIPCVDYVLHGIALAFQMGA